MSVAFDAKSASELVTGGAASMSGTPITVGSGSNRALLVLVSWTNATLPSGVSVKWDNTGTPQTMTQVSGTQVSNSGEPCTQALYGLINPTAGAKTLNVSWTGLIEARAMAVSFTNVDQTSVAVAFPHGNTVSATATSGALSITSATGNMVAAIYSEGATAFSANSGTIIINSESTGTLGSRGLYDNGAASVNTTCSWSGVSTAYVGSGCDVLAVATASNPFKQIDWPYPQTNTWYRSWEWTYNLNLVGKDKINPGKIVYNPVTEAPREPYRSWTYSYNLNLIGKDQVVPGKQYTNRSDPVVWYQSWSQNLVVYTRPTAQYAWPNPTLVQWYRTWEQQGIRTVVSPFRQTDWPLPSPVKWYQDHNLNLVLTFPSGKPFNQQDWVNPYSVQWYGSTEQQGIKTVVIPFKQLDWFNPTQLQWYRDWAQNLVLINPSGKPFKQSDWPLPQIPLQPQFSWSQSPVNVSSVVLLPPNLIDWSNPLDIKWYIDWNQNLVLQLPTTPFKQLDWPNPTPVSWYRDHSQSLSLTTPSGKPFNQQDWSLPKGYYRVEQSWVQNLLENTLKVTPSPFRQQDWPLPQTVNWDRFWSQSPTIPPVTFQPAPSDWSIAERQYWDVFIGENTILLYPPTVTPPSTTTELHFKPILITIGRMGNLGGLS